MPSPTLTKPTPAVDPQGTLMFSEAAEAGASVARFLSHNRPALIRLGARMKAKPPVSVITVARGSSDHAATFGKYLIETLTGVPTSTAAMSVSSIYAAPVVAADGLCIAISQSGRSPDMLATVEAHRKAGAYVVALVNDEDSPLAALADELLPLKAGPEKSVAATKSYIVSLAGLAAIVAAWSGDRALSEGLETLPQQLDQAFALDWSSALPVLVPARNLFVIGRGFGFAIAQEAALKLKETCALHAEAFSSAEVRHGPMAIVNDGFPILAFATSDAAGDGVRDVAAEFAARGANVMLTAPAAGVNSGVQDTTELPALHGQSAIEPILQIASFYRLANSLSLARGLNPDSPPHLNKVTKTV